MGEAGYLQGLLPELWYGVVQTVHVGHHFSCGSDQIMTPRKDWRTPREVDVAVEGYADKGLKALLLSTAQMRITAVSACATHWKASK